MMSKNELLKHSHDHVVSKPRHFLHQNGKKYCAAALCTSLIVGQLGGLAAIADDGENVDCAFELDGENLYEAFQEAIVDGPLDTDVFASGFEGISADEYSSLLNADGNLYELNVEIDESNDSEVSLRIFVCLGEDAEVLIENDLASEMEVYDIVTPSDAVRFMDIYEPSGSEEFIFLLTNSSKEEKTATIRVDNKITGEITILPSRMIEMSEASASMEYSVSEENSSNGSESSVVPGEDDIQVENEAGPWIESGEESGEQVEKSGLGTTDVVIVEDENSLEETEINKDTEITGGVEFETGYLEKSERMEDGTDENDTVTDEEDFEVSENEKDDSEFEDVSGDEPLEQVDSYISDGNDVEEKDVDEDMSGNDDNEAEDVDEDMSGNDDNEAEDVDEDMSGNDDNEAEDADEDMSGKDDVEAENADEDMSDSDFDDTNGEEVIASVSFHSVYRVADTFDIFSDADAINATVSDATLSNATSSNRNLDDLEGIIYESVKFESNGLVAFVVTLDNLGIMQEDQIITQMVQTEKYTVIASYERNVLPGRARLAAFELSDEEKQNTISVLKENNIYCESFVALDVCFVDENGDEIEPDNGTIQVQIELNTKSYTDAIQADAATVDVNDISVLHFKESGDEIEVEAVASVDEAVQGTVDITADEKVVADFAVESFSTFVVMLTAADSWTVYYDSHAYTGETYPVQSGQAAEQSLKGTFGPVYDIGSDTALTEEQYRSLLVEADASMNAAWSTTSNNLPIVWERSDPMGGNHVSRSLFSKQTDDEGNVTGHHGWTWSGLDDIELSLSNSEDIWDGSRLISPTSENNNYTLRHYYPNYIDDDRITVLRDASDADKMVLYDSATWADTARRSDYQNFGAVDIEASDTTDTTNITFHRFQGTFDITSLLSEGDTTLYDYSFNIKPVTSFIDNYLYINDDIYVFVYPESAELSDEKTDPDYFMNYLAFWGGNTTTWAGSYKDENNNTQYYPVFWNGVRGSTRLKSDGDSNANKAALLAVTDGWRMEAVDDNAGNPMLYGYDMHKDETEYIIDVFASDHQSGGAMYRLEMKATPVKRYPLIIQKVDADDTACTLQGARFELYRKTAESENPAYWKTTDENGIARFDVVPGTYIMKESVAPEGYLSNAKEWEVVVNNDGIITINSTVEQTEINASGENVVYYVVTNTAESYDLSITKNVAGNMGDINKKFSFAISWKKGTDSSSENKSFSLAHNETDTWTKGVPVGAEVTISELDPGKYTFSVKSVQAVTTVEPENWVDIEYEEIDHGLKFKMPIGDVRIVVENGFNEIVDTGILLDSMPYVLILAAAAAGAAFYFIRRKKEDEDDLD